MAELRPALEQAVARAGAALERAQALPAPSDVDVASARRQANLDRSAAAEARSAVKHATWRTRRSLERSSEEASERAVRSSSLLDELEAAFEPVRKQRHEARVAHAPPFVLVPFMPRSIQDIIDHADEIAAQFERLEPHEAKEIPVEEYLLRSAVIARARSEQQVLTRSHAHGQVA